MTIGGSGNQSVGALAPASALAALALGVAALLAPLPFLRAPDATKDARSLIPPTPSPPPTRPQPPAIVPEDWSALAASLSKLREPPTQAELALIPADPGQSSTPPADSAAETPVRGASALSPLRWRYLGWIQEPDRKTALVLMNDTRQRFVYPGQEILDDPESESSPIRIVSVSEEELVIRRDGAEERFARTIGESTLPSLLPNPLAPRTPRASPPQTPTRTRQRPPTQPPTSPPTSPVRPSGAS